jgi:hypothetical protein
MTQSMPAVKVEEGHYAEFALQVGDIQIQVQLVDPFRFQRYVLIEYPGNRLCDDHEGAPVATDLADHLPLRRLNRVRSRSDPSTFDRSPIYNRLSTTATYCLKRRHSTTHRSEPEPR